MKALPFKPGMQTQPGNRVEDKDSQMMFCSYIIPTIGRPSVDIAVKSVLDQEFTEADFEVVVVNDSGIPLAEREWFHSSRVRIITTNRSERSFARNAGAAVAKGDYLAFLDDDDWILPGALQHFWELSQQKPDAVWLHGGIRIVDENGSALGEVNSGIEGYVFAQFAGGAWAPLQSSMVLGKAFFEVGGFNPIICGTEDLDLTARLSYHGPFANTPATVACLFRGQSWNTSTNYLRAPEDIKYSRDAYLSRPQAFQRLRRSMDSSYWHGRILRVYLSTVGWNLKRKRFFTALSRVLFALAGLLLSLKHIPSRSFWQGIKAEHVPASLHFIMLEYERKVAQAALQEAENS
jgi:glycosyltransferase involved in cell wall biosynthesis